jgi:hypothetical protein
MTQVVQCPGCDLRLPADDNDAQIAHMEANHPEVIEQRLVAAGFMRDPHTGRWVDRLADE